MEACAPGSMCVPKAVTAESAEARRLRLDLAYDGTLFHGWAAQPGLRTVQGEIEAAIATVFRAEAPLTVAGRTDAGVHAAHQVAHVDLGGPLLSDLPRLTGRLNSLLAASYARYLQPATTRGPLPKVGKGECDVVLHRLTPVGGDFDARFSAAARHYRYLLADEPSARRPIKRSDIWWTPQASLDERAMQQAADLLLGEHDFLSFCKPRPGATTVRELRELGVRRRGGRLEVSVTADAFCHSMVRSLVGALVEVGRGARGANWAAELVARPARDHGVPLAPAKGLTLQGVDYPPPERWAERARESRQVRQLPCS